MTIRGGGDPNPRMASMPPCRMGLPLRSSAADAHYCIMVQILWIYRIQLCGAKLRANWRAPLRSSRLPSLSVHRQHRLTHDGRSALACGPTPATDMQERSTVPRLALDITIPIQVVGHRAGAAHLHGQTRLQGRGPSTPSTSKRTRWSQAFPAPISRNRLRRRSRTARCHARSPVSIPDSPRNSSKCGSAADGRDVAAAGTQEETSDEHSRRPSIADRQPPRRSLACTNIIENVMGTVRRVRRNAKRWRSASMAMRWTAGAMQEAAKGFRRLKAHKQLPALRALWKPTGRKIHTASLLAKPTPLNINLGSDRFTMFNKNRTSPDGNGRAVRLN